jgi:hypothetical protein
MTRKVDPERIRELAAEGRSQTEIAAELGVSHQRISQICVRDGIATKHPFRDPEREQKLLDIVASGERMTATRAAELAGYSGPGGWYALRRIGVSMPRKITWAERYRECADAGMTLSETAARFGKTVQSVFNECKLAGVTFHVKARWGRKKKDAAND